MTTIPARLAQATRFSSSPEDARRRVLSLYRNWYRSAPEVCDLYNLDFGPQVVRRAIRAKIEKNRYVSDPRAIDVLLEKGRQDYQETMNVWKQPSQVTGILLKDDRRPQRTFLQQFYEGRDGNAVRPAATGIPT